MAMYDILRNPQQPLSAIAQRQRLLGGTDVLAEPAADSGEWRAKLTREKARGMRLFYEYVQEEKDAGFPVTWSAWLKQKEAFGR